MNNHIYQARIALKNLGFTENKIKRILQTKRDVSDIMLIDEIKERIDMLESAINTEEYLKHIKDIKTSLILIEGTIRGL